MVSLDVLTMGRISVDVYPEQVGVSLREVTSFGKFLGGSSTNVAVAAARYGRRAATITRTGDDPFGEFLHDALKGFGVDDRYVTAVPGLPTPVTFCEIFPPDDFPLYFYRYPTAPDLQIRADELDLDAVRDADVFWVTVTGLCQEPSREATLAALRARGKRGITVRDLDYRVPLDQVRELNVRPGAALVWRTAVWHTVTPNLSEIVRKVFYVGYHYRWLRPTDYIQQDPALIARSSPIRRQLLGALAAGSHPLGQDPDYEPASQHWLTREWENVPLKAWAEERAGQLQQVKGLHL